MWFMKVCFRLLIVFMLVTSCAKPIIVDTTEEGIVRISGLPAKGSVTVGDIKAESDSNDDPVTWSIKKISRFVDAVLGRSDVTVPID